MSDNNTITLNINSNNSELTPLIKNEINTPVIIEEEVHESLDIKGQTKMILLAILFVIIFIFFSTLFYCLTEDWTILNGIYFAVITMTTVGYGGHHPTKEYTRGVTIIFIFIAIGIIGFALGIIGNYLVAKQEALMKKVMEKKNQENSDVDEIPIGSDAVKRFLWSILVIIILLGVGTLFYSLVEKWNFIDSLYFCVVTCSTVGYGDIVPKTTLGRAVNIPFVLFGTILFVAALGSFSNIFIEMQQKKVYEKMLNEKLTGQAIGLMDQDNDNQVDIHEFLEYKLIELGHCDEKVIRKIKKQFKKLDVDGSGFLDQKDLENMKKINKLDF